MGAFFTLQSWLVLALWVAQIAAVGFAVFDVIPRKPAVFAAAGKLTKTKWVLILVVALAVLLILSLKPLNFLSILAAAAGIIYLVDVKPALQQVSRGGGNGPYG